MDQNLAQIDVASLADAQQLGLAAGRVLAWYEAEPRCEVASLAERSAVADGGDDSRRNDGADVWDLPERRQPASPSAICSSLPVSSSICCSTVFHSSHQA
jgi:hypothetical protein